MRRHCCTHTVTITDDDNSGSDWIKVWINGTLRINVTDAGVYWGTVAFAGTQALFDNVKVGYDNNSDDDIDDSGDDLVWDETFTTTSATVSHDHAGNLIDDGVYRYVYDAWNRLVKVQQGADGGAVTIQTAEFDGLGRRIKKAVTNSGSSDATVVYLYDGQKIVETRLGGQTTAYQQFIHGTQYIDELVMVRVKDKGDLYVHQDANWNVIGLTDLGHRLVERYVYTPYGELLVNQETSFGDRDGDNDVDATDKGTVGVTCTGTVSGSCRILDLDFDGDYDSTDAGLFNSLPQGLSRHPGRTFTGVSQPFAHQGLLFEPEVGGYQNRRREYDPGKRRFLQRDPPYSSAPGTLVNALLDPLKRQQACLLFRQSIETQAYRGPAISPDVSNEVTKLLCDAASDFEPILILAAYEYQGSAGLNNVDPDGLYARESSMFDRWSAVHAGMGCVSGLAGLSFGSMMGLNVGWEGIEPGIWPGWNESGWNVIGDIISVAVGWALCKM